LQTLISPDFKGLVFVGGPTASGKTAMAVHLAEHFKTVILSADSRQIYSELNIGTAKPSAEELQRVQHYFISTKSIHETYSVAAYLEDARQLIATLSKQYPLLIVCGGTGLYLSALKNGIHSLPESDAALRKQLQQDLLQQGADYLRETLLKLDPAAGQRIDLQNPRRVIRAIELVKSTGQPLSKIFEEKPEKPSYKIISFCLDVPREVLYDRINKRVDAMVDQGLEEEAGLYRHEKNHQALQTVGYREWWDYFDGKCTKESTLEAIKQNTRNYAKRQLTWFRKDPENIWIPADMPSIAIEKIREQMFDNKPA
jgi:tRNA dimethylallyltransferase